MATIKPFRGIRPPKELVEQVESRPYDVLDSEEARAEAGGETVTVFIPHDTYITTRAAVLRYYDAGILEFQES